MTAGTPLVPPTDDEVDGARGEENLADNVDDGSVEHGGHSELRCKLVGEWVGGGGGGRRGGKGPES